MKINASRLFWISLGVGWAFDLLFWGKAMGISFPVFVLISIAAGLYAARREAVRPHRASLWLLLPIAFFAVMSAVRLEPLTTFLDRSMTLLLMSIFALSFEGGRWPYYRLRDHFLRLASLAAAVLTRWTRVLANGEKAEKSRSGRWKAALRGLIVALPIFFVFGALLASADPVFGEIYAELLSLLQIEQLLEYIQRGVFILLVAAVLFGVYWQAISASRDEQLPGDRLPLPQFLGFTETVMALAAPISLFIIFVGIQFRYFFFGQANIAVDGFTYAEYARRGFFELVTVSLFSLFLLFALSTFARRETPNRQRVFSWLGVALVALVGVILVSAFMRLSLYEQAYGFTRSRAYAHVFMVWLGLLLAAAATLEISQRSDRFALSLLLAAVGFTASLNLLNVDAFITRANIGHAFQFESESANQNGLVRSPVAVLDLSYLGGLSTDAVPALLQLYLQARERGDDLRQDLAAGALACNAFRLDDYSGDRPWQSFHYSYWLAGRLWNQRLDETGFGSHLVAVDEKGAPSVTVQGETMSCWRGSGFD